MEYIIGEASGCPECIRMSEIRTTLMTLGGMRVELY